MFKTSFTGIAIVTAKKLNVEERKIGQKLVWGISNLYTGKKGNSYNDPFACEMVEKIDYDFSKYNNATRSSVGVSIRSKYFDELTTAFIKENMNPVIVNVGCGLDARFQRIGKAITGKAVFYELDLPEVIKLRAKLLPASNNDNFISSSMFDVMWMDELVRKHPEASFLFVIEGVLMYFEKGLVKEFIQNIAYRFRNAQLIFDVVSSWMCRNSHRHDTVKKTNAVFRFGCDDDRIMEDWADNLELFSSVGYNNFKEWRRAGLLSWLMIKSIPKLRKSSRLLNYKILSQ